VIGVGLSVVEEDHASMAHRGGAKRPWRTGVEEGQVGCDLGGVGRRDLKNERLASGLSPHQQIASGK
jgi:hypothetical protein